MSRLPGPRGVDGLRWVARLARTPYDTLPRLHDHFGEVVAIGGGPMRMIFVFGAAANRELFDQGPDTVSWHDAMAPLIPVDGETAIVVSDGADHERRRRIVQPAFARRRLDDTVGLMAQESQRTFAAWTAGTRHDAYADARACIRRIVVRAWFGDDLGAEADRLGDSLELTLAYINRPPWRRFDHAWPLTPYRAAMRARRAADEIVYAEIARRRSLPDLAHRNDVLSALLAARDDDALTDLEVRDQIISLIAAGYDTTSAAAGWLVHFLSRHPDVVTATVAEITDQLGDAPVTSEALARMPWLNGVVSEALRLGSPGPIAGRKIEAPFVVRGHRLPAGPLVFYSPYVTHRLASLWPDPLSFRPGRWVEGHPDRHDIPAGAWVPFGGGARRCLGFAFAVTELKVMTVELLRATGGRLSPERADVSPTGLASMSPEGGVPVLVG